jgi:hypothetical protein
MVILKSSLIGRPANLVEQLGYTSSQYEMALFKLDQRYGGDQRIMQQLMDHVLTTPPVEANDLRSLEDISNKLCDMVAKMKDQGREQELIGYSPLYTVIQQKIPEKMLVLYLDSRDLKKDGLGIFVEWLNRQVCLRLEAQEMTHKNKSKTGAPGTKSGKSNRSRTNVAKTGDQDQKNKSTGKGRAGTTQQEGCAKPTCPLCQSSHPGLQRMAVQ